MLKGCLSNFFYHVAPRDAVELNSFLCGHTFPHRPQRLGQDPAFRSGSCSSGVSVKTSPPPLDMGPIVPLCGAGGSPYVVAVHPQLQQSSFEMPAQGGPRRATDGKRTCPRNPACRGFLLKPIPYPLKSNRLPIISTVPQMTAGREGSADQSRLSANCPRSVLIASSLKFEFSM